MKENMSINICLFSGSNIVLLFSENTNIITNFIFQIMTHSNVI